MSQAKVKAVPATPNTPLQKILAAFSKAAVTEREKGTYFEELICVYLRNEATYRDLYSEVWTFADWAKTQGLDGRDTGIDLVAQTQGTGEFHAIQCKFYAPDYRVQKGDLDSFFSASGKKPFTHRIIIATTDNWGVHAEDLLQNQQPPVSKIDLHDLENSQIDWAQYHPKQAPVLKPKKSLREHQQNALAKVVQGLQTADRGKLIMACGTGKTFTSLKIAETLAGAGKRVLFLVPSLSLLSQSLTEWTQESATPLHSFAVCSDSDVGKKRKQDDDTVQTFAHELRYPATTNAQHLALEMAKRHDAQHLSVVFSTYHSIEVLHHAQHTHGLADFDLIICDEAHRTTGATFGEDDESTFVKVHDADFIRTAKRLYMTATPRIYGDSAKASAEKDDVALCSMDDPALYGEQLFVITFSDAVKRGLLVDYKVLVLAVDEAHVSRRLQELLKDENNQLKVDDAAKIIGCWKALSKQDTQTDLTDDTEPMRRAVAFCQVIEPQNGKAKTHKVSSKNIAAMFQTVVEEYQKSEAENTFEPDTAARLICQAEHVDGGMNASKKEEKLTWLKAESPADTCRILSNVRCLSEGVDVPALDAVLFLTPRNSQVDVVQSVGRVMRNAPNKKRGYIILPVVIPMGMEAHEALNDNKTYKVVWEVLQALRSHDDRFDAIVNKLDLIGKDPTKMEIIAITDKISKKADKSNTPPNTGKGEFGGIGEKVPDYKVEPQTTLTFEFGEIERAIYAKLVKKCGNPNHWEQWANDIARIAQTHITRITTILENPANTAARAAFAAFGKELRDDLNDSITDAEIIEMLAQHLITKPVFDALFSDYSFASHNPMSLAMQGVLDVLDAHNLDKETDTLQKFYDSVKMKAEGITNASGKQKIIVELYDKFFRNAFPKMTERLGIVYTPVEVVDFIIHSVNDVLQSEFGQTLGSKNVHIIDPFTGTGTFITRLLQSGLISREQLPHKYQHEIHANEIVLLAYYIAAINIESVYHDLMNAPHPNPLPRPSPTSGRGGYGTEETADSPRSTEETVDSPRSTEEGTDSPHPLAGEGVGERVNYQPFNGICLTDTFQLHEKEDLVSNMLQTNSGRRKKQKSLDIRVIIGNPPYSAGQNSANDNNANVAYPHLDDSIRTTYAAQSNATNKNALYDSYIRALRWASNRIGDSGVIGFVSNAGFIEANTGDGLRKCLAAEFSNIYVFHLRGNQRTSGELSRKEGGKIFGSGSRAPIAISILVKNPNRSPRPLGEGQGERAYGNIVMHDIGDYLTQAQKLAKITAFKSIAGIAAANGWQPITPDAHGDWINQRNDGFAEFISMGDKKDDKAATIFENYSRGLETNRDAWCYNASKSALMQNVQRMVDFYNMEVMRYQTACKGLSKEQYPNVDDFINADTTKISWNRGLKSDLAKVKGLAFSHENLKVALYRPFSKQCVYFAQGVNAYLNQMPRIFPDSTVKNRVICLTLSGTKGFSVIVSDLLPDLHLIGDAQCFPLYLYEPNTAAPVGATPQGEMFDGARMTGLFDAPPNQTAGGYRQRDGMTDAGLAHFAAAYPSEKISKADVFYYIYGLLHSEDYKTRYADNLSKELPCIPCVKTAADFWAFSQAGRALAELHLNYETVAPYPVQFAGGELLMAGFEARDYRVEQMKFAKGCDGAKHDKTSVIYNPKITMTGIPLAAYDYIVNGKPALEWVMERQAVTTHKDSGIVNDANDWAIETMRNPRYPLELFMRVITVSLETMKIVRSLPRM